ncbi:acyl-CoA thioesterase [Spongiivirga citrea]|uniref:YbgC/FadM family acyl-CoA thioesterase n=1 Tax=Spongiivirga citrea TaxID=1481457 RepID=A0A6M0CCV0_9FLAO|nr:thioesterase family protein [Spongiivirga citrea]NER15658.1 YbgC/FadM family acyl-CoA thioesterase [Spongiivirga citrea]
MKFDEIQIKVRYGETDKMGVVYHGNYAQYLELGRIEWLDKLGFSYKEMEDSGVMLPVFSLELNYKKSARFGDVLTLKTILKKTPTVKIEFDYEIYNQYGELLTLANTVLAFLDMETNKPIRAPEYLIKKLNSFM